jgi:Golgi phosphoprotein 3 (GPP34)
MGGGLGGTGRIADDLYLMAHHEVTGKPFVQPRTLGIALAGGLLAELMLAGCAGVRADGMVAADRAGPADELSRQVFWLVAGDGEAHPVRDWLLFLARTAAADVAVRLGRSGYLRRSGGRIPGRAGRWVPVDPDWAFAPLIRVRSAVEAGRAWSAHGAVLAGLAAGCGLEFRMAQYLVPGGHDVDEAVGRLDPELQELIAQGQAAVGCALLAHRG